MACRRLTPNPPPALRYDPHRGQIERRCSARVGKASKIRDPICGQNVGIFNLTVEKQRYCSLPSLAHQIQGFITKAYIETGRLPRFENLFADKESIDTRNGRLWIGEIVRKPSRKWGLFNRINNNPYASGGGFPVVMDGRPLEVSEKCVAVFVRYQFVTRVTNMGSFKVNSVQSDISSKLALFGISGGQTQPTSEPGGKYSSDQSKKRNGKIAAFFLWGLAFSTFTYGYWRGLIFSPPNNRHFWFAFALLVMTVSAILMVVAQVWFLTLFDFGGSLTSFDGFSKNVVVKAIIIPELKFRDVKVQGTFC